MKINVDEHTVLELLGIFVIMVAILVFSWSMVAWFGLYAIQRIGIIDSYDFWDVIIFGLFFLFLKELALYESKEK
jgi:hypothetical protein